MPALSGPRSVMPMSMVSRWAPSLDCRAGFFRNSPTIPHMALRPFRGAQNRSGRNAATPIRLMPGAALCKACETFLTVRKDQLFAAAGVADDRDVARRQLAQLF